MNIRFKLNKESFLFYTIVSLSAFMLFSFSKSMFSNSNLLSAQNSEENRVIKCQLPLAKGLTQNVFYMAPDLQTAKKLLFNDKTGLFFDNELFVKTVDFEGKVYVVPFAEVYCDSVGAQVII